MPEEGYLNWLNENECESVIRVPNRYEGVWEC